MLFVGSGGGRTVEAPPLLRTSTSLSVDDVAITLPDLVAHNPLQDVPRCMAEATPDRNNDVSPINDASPVEDPYTPADTEATWEGETNSPRHGTISPRVSPRVSISMDVSLEADERAL